MLVLSRKLYQKVIFHGIDTAVQVVGLDQGTVRLGIEAPPKILILRDELKVHSPPRGNFLASLKAGDMKELRHALRNRLNAACLGLALLRQQEQGLDRESHETLDKIERELQALGRTLAEVGSGQGAGPAAVARPRRALLVEDDRNERELLAGFLRMAGVGVDAVEDGLDALDYLHSHQRPDVILLDMGLPRCDGPTTVKQIRRDPTCQGLKIFAVTGLSPRDFGGDSALAIDRWFLKPLDPQALLRDLHHELAGAA